MTSSTSNPYKTGKSSVAENTIVFVNPLASKVHMGMTGIANIRGYLRKHGIKSEILNVNDLILVNPDLAWKTKTFCDELAGLINFNGRDNSVYFYSSAVFSSLMDLNNMQIWDLVVRGSKTFSLLKDLYKDIENINILGFSLTCHSQLFFTLLSAQYIKSFINKDMEIIVGGSYVFHNRQGLLNLLRDKPIIDDVVSGEGEKAVRDLLLKREKSDIPNLFYLKAGKYLASGRLNDCLPVGDYASPLYERENNLPVLRASNNNCYWNRCAFCTNYNFSTTPKVQIRPAREVIRDIAKINNAVHKCNYFCFSDSAFSKKMLTDLIVELEKTTELSCDYRIFLRLEPWLTEELLLRAHKVGFGRGQGNLVFGLETASPRLIKLMNKGISLKTANTIFDICARNNISTKINFIVNWPTQTREELIYDLEYSYKILKKFDRLDKVFVKINLFGLKTGSDIYRNPEKYNIKILYHKKNALNPKIPFEKTDIGGIKNSDEAAQIVCDFMKKIPAEYHPCYLGLFMRKILLQLKVTEYPQW